MTDKIKKGQNFRFGFYNVPALDRLKAIKNAGFQETMLWWGTDYEETDGTRLEIFDQAEKVGLKASTCHFPSTHSDWLWYGGENGDLFVRDFVNACKECGERGVKHLVIHTTRKLITPEPNQNGLDNFAKMLDAANKYNIIIALENTRFLRYIEYIVNSFKDPHIGFCFDCGHANCFTPGEKPLELFGNLLVTTHLHDNIGPLDPSKPYFTKEKSADVFRNVPPSGSMPDQHRLIGEGNVDLDYVFTRLKDFGAEYYNLESYLTPGSEFYGKLDMDGYLALSYKRLTEQIEKSYK